MKPLCGGVSRPEVLCFPSRERLSAPTPFTAALPGLPRALSELRELWGSPPSRGDTLFSLVGRSPTLLCATCQVPEGRARPSACCQVAPHPDSCADALASCWHCHLITAISPFSAAPGLYLWAALDGGGERQIL